jgi:peptidoglycan/LPS O-acetylase OafA/YrhL
VSSAHAGPRAEYLPHVDGLRGLAVLCVVCFHAFPALLPGGFIGVDVFFVISGFVITRMLLPRLAAGQLRFAEFLSRRIRRLLPSMVLVTVVVLGPAPRCCCPTNTSNWADTRSHRARTC